MKSKSLFLNMREATDAPLRAAKSRGFQRHPAWPGLSSGSEVEWRGEIRFKELRARSPQTRDRVFHPQPSYDSRQCPFQGAWHTLFLEMTNKVVAEGSVRPMDKPTQIEECRAEKPILSQNMYSGAIECRPPGPPRPFRALPSST